MKRTLLATLALAGSLLISGLASAQTATVAAGPKLTVPPSGAANVWNVTLTNAGANVWDVTATAASPAPNGNVGFIQIGFFDALGNGLDIDPAVSWGKTSVAWTTADVSSGFLTFTKKATALSAAPGVNDTFTGQITLTGATAVKSVSAILTGTDNKKVWSGYADVVPDPASLALALTGLAPLGLLRRRRATR